MTDTVRVNMALISINMAFYIRKAPPFSYYIGEIEENSLLGNMGPRISGISGKDNEPW